MGSVRIEYYNMPGGILVLCDEDEIDFIRKLISISCDRECSLEKLLDMVGFKYRVITKEEQFTHTEVKGLYLDHVTSKWWNHYEVSEFYKCPSCNKGQITYYRDKTPGFRESYWDGKCDKCGFDLKE